MGIEALEQRISDTVTIPTIPEVVARIQSMAQDPDVGTQEIGELVAQDAPLSTKVLRIANSAYYGLRQRVLSTNHAAAVLGVRVLRNIVMQAAVMDQFEHLAGNPDFDLTWLWKHSILSAQTCRTIGAKARVDIGIQPDELYTCGLLHDLGQVVMLEALDDPYVDVVRAARAEGLELHLAEQRELGFDHSEVGALVAMRWGLPAGVVASIQDHHAEPAAYLRTGCATIVHMVESFAELVPKASPSGAEIERLFDAAGARRVGLDLPVWVEVVEAAVAGWDRIEL